MLKDTVKVALDDTPFDVTENDKSPDYLASWKAGIFLSFGGIPGEFEHKEALSLICAPYPCFPLSTFLLCGSSTSFSLTVSSSDEGDNFHGSQYLHGCIEKIQIQGKDVDLDIATYKHISISSHSCPAWTQCKCGSLIALVHLCSCYPTTWWYRPGMDRDTTRYTCLCWVKMSKLRKRLISLVNKGLICMLNKVLFACTTNLRFCLYWNWLYTNDYYIYILML